MANSLKELLRHKRVDMKVKGKTKVYALGWWWGSSMSCPLLISVPLGPENFCWCYFHSFFSPTFQTFTIKIYTEKVQVICR